MGNFREVEAIFRASKDIKVLLLDTNNIQFYYLNEKLIPSSSIFGSFDVVLIPGWVHAEYSHHEGKSNYVANIPVPTIIVEEAEDYLPLLGYSDKKLMELFRVASPFAESQKFFNYYRKLQADELPDDWIDQYYEQGFFTQCASKVLTKKNAGEVSILTLCFCLLHRFSSHISHIAIASSDFGIIKLKDRIVKEVNHELLDLNIPKTPPISFLSTDVSLFQLVQNGSIQPQQLLSLRPNPKSSIYIEYFSDHTSTLHQHVLDTSDFIDICLTTSNYKFLF